MFRESNRPTVLLQMSCWMRATCYFLFLPLVLAMGVVSLSAAPKSCLDCHSSSTPTLVQAWKDSRHAAHDVGCADCHGKDHSNIFEVKGAVSAGVCGSCHSKEVREFDQSLHALAMDTIARDPKFTRLSPVMKEMGCNACHQIGAHFSDGSRGKCNSCHSGHMFSAAEARDPAACAACHTGADHPHMEMWAASKHGQLFASEATRDQSATCVTCHMPKGTHNTSIGLTFGNVGNGAVLEHVSAVVKMRRITKDDAKKKREVMVESCLPCHSSRFAFESLGKADQVKFEADRVLADAVDVITSLESEGLLGDGQGRVESVLADGSVGHALVLGGDQLYDGLSPVEQRFFDMFKFHHATTFKGAYHQSPEFTHNEGFLKMMQDLSFINNEAARLRDALEKTRKSTKNEP